MILSALNFTQEDRTRLINQPAEILGEIFPKVSLGLVLWIALYFYEYSETIFELQQHLVVQNLISNDSWIFVFVEVSISSFLNANFIEFLGDCVLNLQRLLFEADSLFSEREAKCTILTLHIAVHDLVPKPLGPSLCHHTFGYILRPPR